LEEELRIVNAQSKVHPIDTLKAVAAEADILAARDAVRGIHIAPEVAAYAARVTAETRVHGDLRLGASTRGTLALVRGSQALALLKGRDFVTPDIVKTMVGPVLEHRLIVHPQAAAMGQSARGILNDILNGVTPPV